MIATVVLRRLCMITWPLSPLSPDALRTPSDDIIRASAASKTLLPGLPVTKGKRPHFYSGGSLRHGEAADRAVVAAVRLEANAVPTPTPHRAGRTPRDGEAPGRCPRSVERGILAQGAGAFGTHASSAAPPATCWAPSLETLPEVHQANSADRTDKVGGPDEGQPSQEIRLRGCADRRVANVPMGDEEPIL